MVTVEVVQDFAHVEDRVEDALAHARQRYGVDIEVIDEYGPAGGWPVVRISGTPSQVIDMLKHAYDYSDEEIVDVLEAGQ